MWWLLAREVLRLRGVIPRNTEWDVMVDMFIYRSPEEQEKDQEADQEGLATGFGSETIEGDASWAGSAAPGEWESSATSGDWGDQNASDNWADASAGANWD